MKISNRNFLIIVITYQTCVLGKLKDWNHEQYLAYRTNPQIRAFLDTISYAEGTFHEYGYHTRYPGLYFSSFEDHPRITSCAPYKGKALCATAAGRYMILAKTWDKIAPSIKASHFSPLNQDKAALELIRQSHALSDILQGKFTAAIYKLNKIWATFPGAPFGQPTKTLDDLRKVYYQRLYHYLFPS